MATTFLRAGLLLALALLNGCDNPASQAEQPTVLEGKTMGTFWRVSAIALSPEKANSLTQKIQAQLDADDQALSTWKPDSALMRFNHSASLAPWPVSADMADIVTIALRVGAHTQGAMDITVGPLVNLWGFGPDKQPNKVPDQA